MGRHVIRIIVIALAVFGVFQLVRPAKTNPPMDRTRTLQASLGAFHPALPVIERSCQNCHSNLTDWPWYSHVAPASWLIARDVSDARAAVNFSDWSTYNGERQRKILNAACERAMGREMPLPSYTLLHPQVTLSPLDARAICDLAHVYTTEQLDVEIEPITFN